MTSAIERQWLILSLLPKPPRRVDAASIAEVLRDRGYDVHRRTIQRDLVQLSAVFPIVADDRHKPYGWRWSENARLPCCSGSIERASSSSPSSSSSLTIRARVRSPALRTVLDGLHARGAETAADPEAALATIVACTVDDTAATRRLLLGFANDVEVLEPDALRRDLAARAARATRLYGK